MVQLLKVFIIFCLIALNSACSEVTLDASDDASLKKSFEKMVRSLPEKTRTSVVNAFLKIENTYIGHVAFRGIADSSETLAKKFRSTIHGMNSEELLQESQRIDQAWRLYDLLSVRSRLSNYQEALNFLQQVSFDNFEIYTEKHGKCFISANIINQSSESIYAVEVWLDYRVRHQAKDETMSLYFVMDSGLSPAHQVYAEDELSRRICRDPDLDTYDFRKAKALAIYGAKRNGDYTKMVEVNPVSPPSSRGLKEMEQKYAARYSDEPAVWSANIMRFLADKNEFIGEAHPDFHAK